jgi:hypothetical protein
MPSAKEYTKKWYDCCCISAGFGPVKDKIMIIIFNFIGAGILIAGIGVGYLVTMTFGQKAAVPAVILEGLVLVALDLIYRMKREDGSLFHPRRGGHISFIPVWIIGLGFLAFGCYGVVTGDFGSSASAESGQIVRARSAQPGEEATVTPRVAPQPAVFRSDARTQTAAQPPVAHPMALTKAPQSLKLNMISGTGPDKLATINGATFAVGETHSVKLAQKTVTLTCLEIRDDSVLAKFDSDSQPMELKFGKSTQ